MSNNHSKFSDNIPSAPDWGNLSGEEQLISTTYLEAIKLKASNGGWDADEIHGEDLEGKIASVSEASEHPYTMLVYGKKKRLTLIPMCRPSSSGRFLMVGSEVLKLFAKAGKEHAYCVWEALQHADLMHHAKRSSIWLTGVHPVKLEDLMRIFPARSKTWVSRRLREIEETVGLLKERRYDDLSGDFLGYAYYPFMTYQPSNRTLTVQDDEVFPSTLHEYQGASSHNNSMPSEWDSFSDKE